MAYCGILVLSNLKHISAALRMAEKYVSDLYVHITVQVTANNATKTSLPAWGRCISQLYLASLNSCATPLNMRVLIGPLKEQKINKTHLQPVKFIFSDQNQSAICEELRRDLNISQETIFLQEPILTSMLEEAFKLSYESSIPKELSTYNTVVLGGTFDRLHLGHKIFLTQAVLRAKKKLVVGVTVNAMNKTKTLSELILPVEQRIADVKQFLKEVDTTLQYEVVPIEDAYGPTKSDPDMDMIVVSAETLRGGEKVNEVRGQNKLRTLDIYVVDLVADNCSTTGPRETKISSSNKRLDLLGTRLRKPEPRPNLPKEPYIVGLTGGIGSGKSQMAQRFEKRGAKVFNCDLIAHSTYEPGQSAYIKIVEHFGKEILDESGRIDRKRLGLIVFSDQNQLEMLSSIVWPETMQKVRVQIREAAEQESFKVAIVEAALLLKAGWDKECHEVWAMIVPQQEAVERIMRRNNLTEEEAKKRVASQPENSELVTKAHVVFSSQWDAEFTDQQAERAWKMLMCEPQRS